MEYAAFDRLVKRVESGADEEVYKDLLATETNSLRIVERVSEDRRQQGIAGSDAWQLPVAALAAAYVRFVRDLHKRLTKGDREGALELLRSPDGMFHAGITLVALAVLALLV
jgi:hypothetical protein